MTIPIPPGMEQVPVSWTLAHTTGHESLAGARGFVRFEPTAVAVALPSMTVLPRPVEARVVAGVMEPVELMVNDPELWNWRVTPQVGVPWTPFHVDVLGPVDLATVAVVPGKGPIRAVVGPPGKGLNLLGEKPSVADLPGTAAEGDAWLIGGDLHVWGGGRWVNAGPIQGPQGLQGERGPQGEKGEKGDPGNVNNHTHPVSDVTGLQAQLDAIGYDSGERDITSRVPDVVSGRVLVWRLGRTVHLTFDSLIVAAPEAPHWLTISGLLTAGFRGANLFRYYQFAQQIDSYAAGPVRIDTGGSVVIYNAKQGTGNTRVIQGTVAFPTAATLPTTLPGTPA